MTCDEVFRAISPEEIPGNPFRMIGKEWMLITAGSPDRFNMMTASWGGLGVLWFKPVCFCFIRPPRYTYEFMERSEVFSLSFFSEKYRPQLNLCGTRSGREIDKVKECGFTPLTGPNGAIFFAEARLVIECRKIYFQDIDPERFLDPAIMECYPKRDFHRMYVGEVLYAGIREEAGD